MLHDQKLLLTQMVTLLAVLDPVGHLTLFMSTTAALTRRERRARARWAVLIALLVLTAFAVGGQYVLHAMDISLLSFQIAGGIVLFLFSLRWSWDKSQPNPLPALVRHHGRSCWPCIRSPSRCWPDPDRC